MNDAKYLNSAALLLVISLIFSLSCSRTQQLQESGIVINPDNPTTEQPYTISDELQPIPPPGADETEMFKVQILALAKYENAVIEKKRLQEFTEKTIFLVNERNLWKLQIGDFSIRSEAEAEQNTLKSLGWTDAFLIRYRISVNPDVPQNEEDSAYAAIYYTVQLIATTNKTEAENMQINLNILNIADVNLIKEGDFWKIRVGSFEDINEATILRNRMREMGFDDSWITKRIKRL